MLGTRTRLELHNAVHQYRASVHAIRTPRPRRRMTPEGRFWTGYMLLVAAVVVVVVLS